MACLKAAVANTLGGYTSRLFVYLQPFQMGCFIDARFLLTCASCGSSSIAELIV